MYSYRDRARSWHKLQPHHWEQAERASAQIYYSTREPKSVLIHLTGLTREERKALADMPIEVDLSALKNHDYDGFGVHLPGLIVTTQGTAIAVCQKRHGSMGDGGNQVDILMSRSEDSGRYLAATGGYLQGGGRIHLSRSHL